MTKVVAYDSLYDIYSIIADEETEISSITDMSFGSKIYAIDTKKTFIADSVGVWAECPSGGGGAGGSNWSSGSTPMSEGDPLASGSYYAQYDA